MEKKYCTAVVLAGGSGKRMGTKVHKQYLMLKGYPVLYYSLKAFQDSSWIDEIVLVSGTGEEEYCQKEIVEKYGFSKVRKIVLIETIELRFISPYAKTVKVCKYAGIYIALQDFPGNSWVEAVIWNVICAPGKNLYAVYHDGKFLAPLVILTGYRDGAETDAVLPGIKNGLAGFQLDRQGV